VKVVLLAGGMGSRLAEETEIRPKPMVEIGSMPIIWHIMKHYAHYGFDEFYVALGYKGGVIKRFFMEYSSLNCDLRIELKRGATEVLSNDTEDWVVNLMDTGLLTSTGGRIKRLEKWIDNSTFMLTYGDGVSNVDLSKLLKFHREHGRIATVTAVRPPGRFGGMDLDDNLVTMFEEKGQIHSGWINGGFFVFEPTILDYIDDDDTVLEAESLVRLANEGQLAAYQHRNFWQCMDTLRDKRYLESLWNEESPPWKTW